MQAQIEVIRGPATGYRVDVPLDAPLVVGRAPGVGLCINDDPTISRQHCQITAQPPDCRLTSLSSNGTYVNGHPTTEMVLMNGDEISLGTDSVLKIRIIDGLPANIPTAPPLAARGASSEESSAYTEELCASGLMQFSGCQELPGPWEVVQGLSKRGPLYAIVDFKRLEMAAPKELNRDSVLFDWLPETIPLESSPLLIAASRPELEGIIKQGWGRDAIIVLSSQLDFAAVLTHLRKALKFNAQGKPQAHPTGLLGVCWPSILQQLLAHRPAEFVANVMAGIDVVLLEAPESPSGWQILAPATFSAVLKELGLELESPSKANLKNKKTKK